MPVWWRVCVNYILPKSFPAQRLATYDRQCPAAKTKARQRQQAHDYRTQRCNVFKELLGEDYRGMSQRLAECPLLRRFCEMAALAAARVRQELPAKLRPLAAEGNDWPDY